jgi:hypothetical protein
LFEVADLIVLGGLFLAGTNAVASMAIRTITTATTFDAKTCRYRAWAA